MDQLSYLTLSEGAKIHLKLLKLFKVAHLILAYTNLSEILFELLPELEGVDRPKIHFFKEYAE